jgi:scyllo-inosose 3-dehydrogenase
MKALQLSAEWQPKASYPLSDSEKFTRKVQSGSSVWRNPNIEVTKLPDPVLKADEVMVQVSAVGICGSDMHMVEADREGYMLYPGLTRFPNILGHEFSGRVLEVGKDVADLKVGDLVTVEEIQWCGLCDACRKGLVNHCTNMEELGFTTPGAMAEFISVKAKYCWKITELAERLGDEKEALLLAACLTAFPRGSLEITARCLAAVRLVWLRLRSPKPQVRVRLLLLM